MEAIAGFEPTGRSTIGPGADLVELGDDNGYRHTAVVFHPELRDHPAIGAALDVVLSFLQEPYVTGLLELVAMDHDEGAFVYPTGQAWSAAEVVRALADKGEVAGVRAGLELMYAAGEVLVEASEAGEPHGVYSHGGLTPWRVMLKADGQVEILGYALPQVEILQFHADSREVPKEDSFRYCPPERMEDQSEELSADLFALALIAFELMTGKPVYDGLVNDIRTQASRGEGSRRLFRFKDQLPDSVRELLTLCLRARPEDRHASGQDFLDHVRRVLSAPEAEGPALMDVMAQVSRAQRRHGESLDDGKTMGMSREEIQRILGEQEAEEQAPKRAQSWSPPAKGRRARKPRGREAAPPPPPAEPEPPPPPEPRPAQELRRSRNAPRRARRSRRDRPAQPQATPAQAQSSERTTRPTPVVSPPSDEPTRPTPQPKGIPSEPSQVSPGGRWGRAGGRRRARKAPAASPHESLDAPTEAARDFVDNQAADELLSQLTRSSGDRPVRGPEERSASDVIEAILQGSTSGDKPARPRKKKPKPVSEIQGSPKRREEPTKPRRAKAKPAPQHTELALESAASAPVQPVHLEKAVQETTAEIPISKPRPKAPPSRPESPSLQQASGSSFRPPDPMPSTAAGKPESFRLRRGPGGSVVKTRIPTGFSLAEAVSFLTGSVLPLRTDLQGRVRLGYRLGDEEGPHDGTKQISSFQAGSTLVLHPVPAREVWVRFEVYESQEEDAEPTRFRSVVNTAVNAATVADALTSWMGLPPVAGSSSATVTSCRRTCCWTSWSSRT